MTLDTDFNPTIERYANEAARLVAGPASLRQRVAEDITAHLCDAADAGQLEATLQRLGPPSGAAAAFSTPLRPVSFTRRTQAAAIDALPLAAVTAGLLVDLLVSASPGDTVRAVFPPIVAVDTGQVCVSPLPFVCETGFHATTDATSFVLVACALFWSIAVIGVLEARTGQTPGKRAVGIYTTGRDGLRATIPQAIGRRLNLLMGPLAWLDWLPYLWGDARRISDHVVDTRVGAPHPRER